MTEPEMGGEVEETLRETEERFRLLVESVKDYAIFMLDPRGIVSTWNVGAERIKGYKAHEIIGRSFETFYPPDVVATGKCAWELEVAAREGRFEDEGWRLRKDGSRFWANVVITALRDERGKLVGYAKVTRDLTERVRAEQQRVELAKVEHTAALLGQLHGVAGALGAARTPQEIATIIVAQGSEAVHAKTAILASPVDGGAELEVLATFGVSASVAHVGQRFPGAEETPLGVTFRSATAQWAETPEDLRARFPAPRQLPATGALASLPLIAGGRVVGAVVYRFDEARKFPLDERALLQTMAAQAAAALDRASAYARERDARARLSTTVHSIGDAVVATDTGGAITMMNPVAEALTKWPESEARGRRLSEVFHIINEQTRALVQSPVDRVLETGTVVALANHTLLVQRDGGEIPIEDSGAPIRAEGGDVEGVVLVFRDASKQKRAEWRRTFLADATSAFVESLDAEEVLRRAVQLAVPRLGDWCAVDVVVPGQPQPQRLAVAHTDPAKVRLATELQEKYPPDPSAPTGVPAVLRTGKSELYRDIPDEMLVAGAVDDEHLRIARSLGLRSAICVPLVARDRIIGAMTFVMAESGRRYDEDDVSFAEDLGRRLGVAFENAQLYKAEQSARRAADVANRAKDEFLAIVSHELRTPLNAILGWSKLMASQEFDEARRQRATETIARNAVAMAQLVEDLLDMSRIVTGKMRLDVRDVPLESVVAGALESIRPAADAKDIRIATQIDADLPTVAGDPARLQQVVWNLLSNAVKFTARGGAVAIEAHARGDAVEMSVRDNGIGIAPRFLPHVFDAFSQEDARTTRSRGGLGLGLAITQRLVELHGGRIEAASQGEGRGATFTVQLPVARTQRRPDAQPRRTKPAPSPELRGLRVLVVDDEPDARELVAAILGECECQVTLASNVDDALAAFDRQTFDVVLADIAMPERDGFDLIRRIRSLPAERGGAVPAAALTANARPEDKRKMLDAGYTLHLAKPIEPSELASVVATLRQFAPGVT